MNEITHVLFAFDKMVDFDPAVPAAPVSQDYIDALSSNAARQGTSNHMEIIFSGTAFTVKINGDQVYHDAAAGLTLGQFTVQSHWASGVVFSNIEVTSNGS